MNIPIQTDIPTPVGRRHTEGDLPTLRKTIAALQPGQSFTWHRDQTTLYLAAKQTGRKITSRKLTQGGYRCWLQSNPTP